VIGPARADIPSASMEIPMDPDEFLSRALIRPQPKILPKIELDDVIGAVALAGLFFVLFVLPWGAGQ
jgi:hypothetical protein